MVTVRSNAATVRRLQLQALANGGALRTTSDGSNSRATVAWDVAGNCLDPQFIEMQGRPLTKNRRGEVTVTVAKRTNFIEYTVRCRKCEKCLRAKAQHWRYRAQSEYRNTPGRTWMCTLTLSTPSWLILTSRARVRLAKSGVSFDGMDELAKFREVDAEGYREIQKWMKRLRKNIRAPFRSFCVTEEHNEGHHADNGVPHWHVLLHEQDPEAPLLYDCKVTKGDLVQYCPQMRARSLVKQGWKIERYGLKDSWELGFDSYELARDARGASYACKYLTKSIAARVRPSKDYGRKSPPTPPYAPSGTTRNEEWNA